MAGVYNNLCKLAGMLGNSVRIFWRENWDLNWLVYRDLIQDNRGIFRTVPSYNFQWKFRKLRFFAKNTNIFLTLLPQNRQFWTIRKQLNKCPNGAIIINKIMTKGLSSNIFFLKQIKYKNAKINKILSIKRYFISFKFILCVVFSFWFFLLCICLLDWLGTPGSGWRWLDLLLMSSKKSKENARKLLVKISKKWSRNDW